MHSTLEGAAHVEALGVEQVAVAGTTVTVRVDENLMPVAPPSLPHAYNMNEVKTLPVQSLERKIIVASPVNVTPTTVPTMTYTPASSSTDSVVSTATDISSATIEASATPGQTDTVVPATDTVVPPPDTVVPPPDTAVPPPPDTDVPPPPDTDVPPPPDTDVPPPPDTDVPPPDTAAPASEQGMQSQNTAVPPTPPAATSEAP